MFDYNKPEEKGVLGWIDARFPLSKMYKEHMSEYYAPKNFNFWYIFGVLSMVVLVIQIVTGIFLVMNYKPDASLNAAGVPVAFASVEYIMREVPGGKYIRLMHSTGASMFFVVVYLHMFRGLLYGSYRKPRELVWIFGCLIFLALMAEAFMGYLLPWGQMSFWGAQVIVNLFSAIPVIGQDLSIFIRGDYVVGDATLNRFFALHVIAVPLVLLGLVVAHIIALHEVGSNNPDGVEIKKLKNDKGLPLDGIPFHPYYSVHDFFGICVFMIFFFAIVFFKPNMWGYFLEDNNYLQANAFQTPPHIAPVWYFTPFYSMLRAVTDQMKFVFIGLILLAGAMTYFRGRMAENTKLGLVIGSVVLSIFMFFTEAKFWGVVVMGAAIITLFFLPWLDRSPVKSMRYRPKWHFALLMCFVVNFAILGYLGVAPTSTLGGQISQVGTLFYFGYLFLMPWWSSVGEFKTPPERVNFKPH
ncbi:cytochrome b [Hydromonas duriensis]|uniref:Cytochrome b n=1 Tax=Hydromonas duriensis TaxID=1527608 RepID=A0A4R6YBM3_9BURK|nr:cytochrome bc complex cytochrome b subunit [Hydromonas duriensis]TDR33042.1 ubiquinol-cytochrome c reductase cytochrome b subunit [Hydromonas duriensis]